MKSIWKIILGSALALTFAAPLSSAFFEAEGRDLRVLYWNIQNGMWSDQGNNYDNFVEFVRSNDPDVCVWCEAESRYRTDTADKMAGCEEAYLPWNWDILARRYGHNYVLVCGKRDTFPQVITSKYPLRIVKRVTGNGSDIIVVHGAGWAQIDLGGKTLNVVTLHTWPQKYAYMASDQAASAKRQEGDEFRAKEMEYICAETIGTVPGAEKQYWMMLGDFNAISRMDNSVYGRQEDDKAFLVHDYIAKNTPYIDVVERFHEGEFQKTTLSGKRIDFVYMTAPLFRKVRSAEVITTGFAESSRDPRDLHSFCNPSDHYPILVTLRF